MLNRPLVTWLMPTLNGMPYVRETLASITGQTYRNHLILAWDNGSTDGTLEELRRWIPAHLPGRIVTGARPGRRNRRRTPQSVNANLLLAARASN
jgi:glycosyltransferase involved in cell wall biosynthesis